MPASSFRFTGIGTTWQIDTGDELPEVVHSVAGLLFPHYVRQIPSASVVEFTPGTLIEAIGAWENGEHYSPATIQP